MKNNIKKDIVLGTLSIIVGLLCLLVFGPMRQARKDICTETTSGTVTMVSRNDAGDSTSYDITVEYEIDGQKYTHRCSSGASAEIGETLTVWYDPADHNTCYVETVTSQPFMIRLAGIVFSAIGVFTVIPALIRMRKTV